MRTPFGNSFFSRLSFPDSALTKSPTSFSRSKQPKIIWLNGVFSDWWYLLWQWLIGRRSNCSSGGLRNLHKLQRSSKNFKEPQRARRNSLFTNSKKFCLRIVLWISLVGNRSNGQHFAIAFYSREEEFNLKVVFEIGKQQFWHWIVEPALKPLQDLEFKSQIFAMRGSHPASEIQTLRIPDSTTVTVVFLHVSHTVTQSHMCDSLDKWAPY